MDKIDHAFKQRVTDKGEVRTNYRLGKSREYYASQDYRWVPAQVRKGDLVLIHDMVHHKAGSRTVHSMNILKERK